MTTQPAGGRRRDATRLKKLHADNSGSASIAIQAHLAIAEVDVEAFRKNWSLSAGELASLLEQEQCEVIDGYAVSRNVRDQWSKTLLDHIESAHAHDESLQGLKQSEVTADVPEQFRAQLLNGLVNSNKLTVQAGRFLPVSHQVALSEPEQKLLDQVMPHLDRQQPPSLGDLGKIFRASSGDLAKRLHALVTKKYLIRISDNRYYVPKHLVQMAGIAQRLAETGPFTVRQYRDAAETGRNVAIEVLEYFDRVGYTRRDGDTRQVVGEPSRITG